MMLSFAPLLLHSDSVPPQVRRSLRDAHESPPDERTPHLEAAARALHRELDLDCCDARELVGLPSAAEAPC